MLIWALFAGLTAVAVVFVLAPLARRTDGRASAVGDVSVYRDQLAEIDRDLAAGLVPVEEADAARAEIGRRILRAAARAETEAPTGLSRRARAVALLAVVVIPAVTVGLYLRLGHPDLPDLPLLARKVEPKGQSIGDLLAKVEAHLVQEPNDLRGWEVVIPVYMRMGRAEEAVTAIRNTIRIGGSTEKRQIALGEALVAAADGRIAEAARDAFREALKLEPTSVLPRMYLAAALAQDGKLKESASAWAAIVASGTAEDEWLPVAREELAKAEAAAGIAPSKPDGASSPEAKPAPGPTPAEVEAASKMNAGDRSQMIADMVARLDERLKTSGGSIDEWERLVKALKVMGRTDEARAALARARAALATDASAAKRLDGLADGL